MKQFFVFIILSLWTFAAFGQSLEGGWEGSLSEVEMDGDDMLTLDTDYTFTFTGNTFSLRMGTTVDLGMTDVPPFLILATVEGEWTRSGDVLTMVPYKHPKPRLELKADGVPGVVRVFMAGKIKRGLARELQETQRYEIQILTDTARLLKEIPSEKDLRDPDFEPESLSLTRK